MSETGRRDRKRVETRERIRAAALDLFFAQGFETTTLDQIADAADVSRRTLFHYFDGKEDIVLDAKGDFASAVADAVGRRPAGEPLLIMAEEALAEVAQAYRDPAARALARLVHDTPQLRIGEQAKYETVERTLASALALKVGIAEADEPARIVAALAVAVLRHAVDQWVASASDHDAAWWGRQAFAAVRRLVGDAQTEPTPALPTSP